MRKKEGQIRELLNNTEYMIARHKHGSNIVLRNKLLGIEELWTENNDFAGYVIVIGGKGFEFVRSLC